LNLLIQGSACNLRESPHLRAFWSLCCDPYQDHIFDFADIEVDSELGLTSGQPLRTEILSSVHGLPRHRTNSFVEFALLDPVPDSVSHSPAGSQIQAPSIHPFAVPSTSDTSVEAFLSGGMSNATVFYSPRASADHQIPLAQNQWTRRDLRVMEACKAKNIQLIVVLRPNVQNRKALLLSARTFSTACEVYFPEQVRLPGNASAEFITQQIGTKSVTNSGWTRSL
jgi:hypothetical protein